MRVLKVEAEGLTTSFRYPYFMQQIQPSFEMPPPATIYGHIASALGDWFDPTGIRFAYHFTYAGQVDDLEHTIILSPSQGKLGDLPKVLEGKINPFERTILFKPRLTLYINRPEWEEAFRSPHYAVALGRSQDLFTYTKVEIVELEQANQAYFEHTLLPHSVNLHTSRGYAVLMPRYLDYSMNRAPAFAQYFIVSDRIFSETDFLWFQEKPKITYLIDPSSPEYKEAHLGLAFLSFVGEMDETIGMA
jgi:CRISPR-associated protein Cas5t